jgi:hypothetical protein
MRVRIIFCLSLFFLFGLTVESTAQSKKAAKKAKKAVVQKPKKELVASKQTVEGIDKLMGGFKWGMPSAEVIAKLEKNLRAVLEPDVKKLHQDILAQDRARKEMLAKLEELKKSYVQFTGKKTTWEVSMIDKEFAHKNNESMAVVWEKTDRRFYFFHNDKLWKIFLAFNSDQFADKTFEDFAQVMETRFGKAERKFTPTMKGDAKMDHLAWPAAGKTLMRAIDNTGFYGSFCLVLIEKDEWKNVRAGRKVNSPKKEYTDPLVDAVTKDGEETGADSEHDIVDRITGKGATAPNVSDTGTPARSPSSSTPPPAPAKPANKGKKVSPNNPLDGLDI